MATPAAVLSILVRAQGAQAAIGQLNGVDAAARKASGGVDTLEKKSKKGQAAFASVSKAAGATAIGVGLVGGAAVKAASDYESSMNVLQSVSGATGREMDRLSKLAIRLGADTKLPGTSAKDASEAMVEMTKAGLSLKDTMAGVRDVLVLSAAAGVTNAEAAEIASNALNSFKLAGKDVGFVTDQLANTANASSVEIRDVSDAMKMASAVFSGFQAPVVGAKGAITELNTAIGILGNAGIKGSDAGTSLKQMLLQLTGPSDKAKGAMRALYVAAEGNRVSQEQLTGAISGGAKARNEAIQSLLKANPALKAQGDIAFDAAGKMRPLKDIIALVAAGTKNMTQEQKSAYITQIFGADASRAVIALMNAGLPTWNKMEAAVTKQGAAQDLANSKMKGFKGSMEALKSTLETLAINVGTKLLPALTKIVKAFSDLAGALSPTAWLVLIGTIGTFAASIWGINAALKAYKAAQTAATAATWLFNIAMRANPAGVLITALTLLGIGLVAAYKKSETFRNVVDTAFRVVRNTIIDAIDAILGGLSSFLSAYDKLDQRLGGALPGSAGKGARAIDALREKIRGLRDNSTQAERNLDRFKRSIDSLPNRKSVEIVAGVTVKESTANKASNFDVYANERGKGDPGSRGTPGGAVRKAINNGARPIIAAGVRRAQRNAAATVPGYAGQAGAAPGKVGGLAAAAKRGLAMIQQKFGGVQVTSGFRTVAENRRVGGASNSDHLTGNALDLRPAEGWTPAGIARMDAIARWAKQSGLVRWIGWRGVPGHGPGDHLHLSFLPMAARGPTRGVGDVTGRMAGVGDVTGGMGNAKRIWQFLLSKGFTPAQAAGILGNLNQESRFDPTAVEGGGRGPGIGIAQWSFGRATALKSFARSRGTSWKDLGTQLAFMMHEFRGPEKAAYKAVKSAKSIEAAESAFGLKYERYGVMGDRSGRKFYNAFKNVRGRGGGGGNGPNAEALRRQVQKNLDKIDALRKRIRGLPTGKKSAGQRADLQNQIADLLTKNRHIREQIRTAPKPAERVNPYEQKIAEADLLIAQLETAIDPVKVGSGRTISKAAAQSQALLAKQRVIDAEAKRIRSALKRRKGMTPQKRLELTQRLAALVNEHAQIGAQRAELGMPLGADTSGTDTSAADAASEEAQRQHDEAIAKQQELIQAIVDHMNALQSLQDEITKQNQFATDVRTVQMGQLAKGLADFISGQIGGYGGAGGRALTAGAGTVVRY